MTKTNLCLRRRVEQRRASDCLKARIVKKGLDSKSLKRIYFFNIKDMSSNTLHFNLMLDFEDERPLKIAETTSRAQIKKKVRFEIDEF